MKVKSLIKLLQKLDRNAEVRSESFMGNTSAVNMWAYEVEQIKTDYGKEVIIKFSE
tara:strand:- start:414 stop:581 length:168 start_codon:yes stop_codon:yes gene_type:complete